MAISKFDLIIGIIIERSKCWEIKMGKTIEILQVFIRSTSKTWNTV